jgi:hypothetical protein
MKRYIEPSYKARLVFFFLVLLWAGLVLLQTLLQKHFDEWFPLAGTPVEQVIQSSDRHLLAVIVFVVFYLTLSGIVVFVAIWTVRSRQWPPHGHPMPFRTPVKEIKNPIMVWLFAGFILIIYISHIALSVYAWSLNNKLLPEIIRLLEPPKGDCTTPVLLSCATPPHSTSSVQ